MRCYLKYYHPVTNNPYLFVDLRFVDGVLKPRGCFLYRRDAVTVFETKREARKISDYLESLGYRVVIRPYSFLQRISR